MTQEYPDGFVSKTELKLTAVLGSSLVPTPLYEILLTVIFTSYYFILGDSVEEGQRNSGKPL